MTFNPSVLGFISTTGITRSETVFEKNQNFLTVTSDGNPSPARVDITEVQDQSYNFSFVYRAGDNTQSYFGKYICHRFEYRFGFSFLI